MKFTPYALWVWNTFEGNKTTNCQLITSQVLTEATHSTTPSAKNNPIRPHQLDLVDSINASSPLASSSKDDDDVLFGGPRKCVHAVIHDSSDGEQSARDEERVDTRGVQQSPSQESIPSCSSRNVTPTPVSKRLKMTKSEDDAIPLPDPFPLPKHTKLL